MHALTQSSANDIGDGHTMAALVKSLSRLNRATLIEIAQTWLQDNSQSVYLARTRTTNEAEEEDYLFTPAEDVNTLRQIYNDLRQQEEQVSKAHIIDRIVDGDWRRGLSLAQHAMVDFAYLEQNDTALRWSALKLVPLQTEEAGLADRDEPSKKRRKIHHEQTYPQISPSAFVAALKSEISPLVKAHYHLHRLPPPYNLAILRVYILPTGTFGPRKSAIPRKARQATDAGRVMYIAIPNSCPFVYISLSGSSNPTQRSRDAKGPVKAKVDMACMKRIVLEAIPKAMSRPQERWALESTKLTTRSLKSIRKLRGNEQPGSGGGAYSKLSIMPEASAEAGQGNEGTRQEGLVNQHDNRHRLVEDRFGSMSDVNHAPLNQVTSRFEDIMNASGESRSTIYAAPISISFSGPDVFAGLKTLASLGPEHVDLARLPAWMTGEKGVSSITV